MTRSNLLPAALLAAACCLPGALRAETTIVGPEAVAATSADTDFPQSCRVIIYSNTKEGGAHACSATIVSKSIAVTAAHCTYKKRSKTTNTELFCGMEKKRYTGIVERPASFKGSGKETSLAEAGTDSALIYLDEGQAFETEPAAFAKPDQLETFLDPESNDCVIVGWGQNNAGTSGELYSAPVTEIAFPPDHPSAVTVGLKKTNKNATAAGDSGGALMCRDNGKLYLLGVNSAGDGATFSYMANTVGWSLLDPAN